MHFELVSEVKTVVLPKDCAVKYPSSVQQKVQVSKCAVCTAISMRGEDEQIDPPCIAPIFLFLSLLGELGGQCRSPSSSHRAQEGGISLSKEET